MPNLKHLINFIENDSVKIKFLNDLNDTLSLYMKNGISNNFRFRVTDDNREIVGLRVSTADKNVIKLDLEPGTIVRKIREREIIPAKLVTDINISQIKKDNIRTNADLYIYLNKFR